MKRAVVRNNRLMLESNQGYEANLPSGFVDYLNDNGYFIRGIIQYPSHTLFRLSRGGIVVSYNLTRGITKEQAVRMLTGVFYRAVQKRERG